MLNRVQGCPPRRSEEGTALIEFTLVFPIFILLLLNVMNFGFYIYAWVTVGNAARAALEYQVYNECAVVTCPAIPSNAAVNLLFTTDVSSLPNSAPALLICKNVNGTVSVVGGSGTCSMPSEPIEGASFTIYSADVTYPFTPFVAAGSLTYLLPTTIHQQAVMRAMQ